MLDVGGGDPEKSGNVAFIDDRIGSCSHAVSASGKGLEKVGKEEGLRFSDVDGFVR